LIVILRKVLFVHICANTDRLTVRTVISMESQFSVIIMLLVNTVKKMLQY